MDSKDTFFSKKQTLNIRNELLDLSKPRVMGILNITTDSFYDGGMYPDDKSILARVDQIIGEGAAFIDVGAYSSRPGAKPISENEELAKLVPVISMIRKNYPDTILSVDTFRAGIARKMVEDYEIDMINDISAGEMDEKMFETISILQVPYIMMHMRGTPENMQDNPVYENVTREIITFFAEKLQQLKLMGVHDVIIDPGFGFGKTMDQNYELLSRLDAFEIFELPVMVGLSRKSMIYKLINGAPTDALNGSTVLHTIALQKGADILRVHDVKEAVEAIIFVDKMKQMEG